MPDVAPVPGGALNAATGKDGRSKIAWIPYVTEVLGGPGNATRTILELTRWVPGLGLVTGLVADGIALVQDLEVAKQTGSPALQAGVAIRDVISVVNNVLGGASSAAEYFQDAVAPSGAGTPAVAATAPLISGIKTAKLWADGLQGGLDIFMIAGVRYNAAHSPRDSAELAKWNQALTMLEANLVGDAISGLVDTLDVMTGGFTNAENVKSISKSIYCLLKAAGPVGRAAFGVLNNVFGVHGAGVMPTSRGTVPEPEPSWHPAPPTSTPAPDGGSQHLALQGKGGVGTDQQMKLLFLDGAQLELQSMHTAWSIGDKLGAEAEKNATLMEQRLRALGTQLNGGKDPFLQMRDLAHKTLDKMHHSVAELTDMAKFAGDSKDKTNAIVQGADAALAGIDQFRLPEIHVPKPKDTGLVADLEGAGSALADKALQALLAPIRARVDGLRAQATEQVNKGKAKAADVAEFLQILQETSQKAVNDLNARVGTFSAKLAKVQNGEQLIDLLIHQVTEMMGIPNGVGIADGRKAWTSIGDNINKGEDWVKSARAQLATSGTTPPAPRLAAPKD